MFKYLPRTSWNRTELNDILLSTIKILIRNSSLINSVISIITLLT